MMFCWCLTLHLVLLSIGGQCLPSGGSDMFSSSLACQTTTKTSMEHVNCEIKVENVGADDVYLSKWFTPLEGLKSDSLKVTRDGKGVFYDGLQIHRKYPPPLKSYVRLAPKSSISKTFDLSECYSTKEPGEYKVSMDITNVHYYVPKMPKQIRTTTLKTSPTTFGIRKRAVDRVTIGEKQRSFEQNHIDIKSDRGEWKMLPLSTMKNSLKSTRDEVRNKPLPAVVKGEAVADNVNFAKRLAEMHNSSYTYAKACELDVMNKEDTFKAFFGEDLSNRAIVSENFKKIATHLENTVMTYYMYGSNCTETTFSYTFYGSTTIFVCHNLFGFPALAQGLGYTIMSFLMRSLTMAILGLDYLTDGLDNVKDLAKNSPEKAIRNVGNYGWFVMASYPFDYGMDVMIRMPEGITLIFKGNFFAYLEFGMLDPFSLKIYSSPLPNIDIIFVDQYYPLSDPLDLNGIDTIFRCDDTTIMFITKGSIFFRCKFTLGENFECEAPQPIKGNFGDLDDTFNAGFDSACHFPDGYTYITKGNRYVRYKDLECKTLDKMPTLLTENWAGLPPEFQDGFDTMMNTEDKTYITKGEKYIRYNHADFSAMDQGYPKKIKGNFGEVNQYLDSLRFRK